MAHNGHERRGTGGAFFKGLTIGGLIGAVIALLRAPQSGEETRQMIRMKAEETREGMQEAVQSVKETVKDKVGEVRQQSRMAIEAAEVALEEQTDRVKTAVEAGKDAYTRQEPQRSASSGR